MVESEVDLIQGREAVNQKNLYLNIFLSDIFFPLKRVKHLHITQKRRSLSERFKAFLSGCLSSIVTSQRSFHPRLSYLKTMLQNNLESACSLASETLNSNGLPLKGVKCQVLVCQSCPTLCDSMDCSLQAPLSMEFSRQEYWSGLRFLSPEDLPDPGIEPGSPSLQEYSFPGKESEPPGKLQKSKGRFKMWLNVDCHIKQSDREKTDIIC